jgi:penicillin amidase
MFRRRHRGLWIGLLVLVILVGLVVGVGAILVRRQFPTVEGTISLPGIQAPVEVYRDGLGIPHIYASNPHDLFMAQGFIHAQDRFWQMEFSRRIGSGRLSEVLGSAGLDSDRFIRTVGWARTAAQELELLDPETRTALEGYAEGVNAYLSSTSRSRIGLEFVVFGLIGGDTSPEAWTPLNTLTWAKVMSWDLGGNMDDELLRARLAARVGTLALAELMPPYSDEYPVIVPEPLSEASLGAVPLAAYDTHFLGFGPEVGSNNWVISGDRTETGMPLLANDPHLGIQMPSIWYEIGLHCEPVGPECPYNVVGSSFPGAAGVIIGHNDRIAWGVTNLGPDVQDLFIERINPENPDQYEVNGRWEDMEVIREEILVAGQDEPEIVFARLTRHGPIINDVVGGEEEDWSFGWEPLALSWTALEPGTLMRSVLLLNRAQDWDQFREALSYWDVPSQNFVYADVDGNIGYQSPGRIPIRRNGDGSMPVPGWNSQYEWVDTIPYDSLPRAFNPPDGYVVTANNAVVRPDFPYLLTLDWDPGYRAQRIVELIQADDSISLADIQAIQGDNTPVWARLILPSILTLSSEDSRVAEALDLLRAWDGREVRDSAGAAVFESFRLHLVEAVFADELGEDIMSRALGSLMVALPAMLENPEAVWFDDVATPEVRESRDEILLQALSGAVEDLTDTLGKNMGNWRWGDLHTATFENGSLGQSGIWPIERIFNRGPFEVDGSIATVNNTGYNPSEPFSVVVVPSYRQIIDVQDLSRSVSMHTTGQSGHPFHPHYNDMIDSWRNIQYHPMLWNREDVVAASTSHLTLTP